MHLAKRWSVILVAGFCLFAALPAWAADVDKYLPDDSETVLTVNVKQILDSAIVKKYALDHLKTFLKENKDVGTILDALGFDPLKDLTSVTAAGSGGGADGKGVVIAHGQFDTAKFEAQAKKEIAKDSGALKLLKEGGHDIYEVNLPNSPKPLYLGFVDKTTIVAGTEKGYINDAFDKASGKAKGAVTKELQGLIEKTDAKQSIWLVTPGSALAKSDLAGDEKAKKILDRMDSLSIGMTLASDFKFAVNILAKSGDGAKEVAEEVKEGLKQLQGLVAVMASQQKQLAPVVDLVGGIKVNTEDKTVSIKAEVSAEQIEKGLKEKD